MDTYREYDVDLWAFAYHYLVIFSEMYDRANYDYRGAKDLFYHRVKDGMSTLN